MSKSKIHTKFRIYHRYLGFFLAGIMCIYAVSGIILIFRTTDFLKIERTLIKELPIDTPKEELGRMLSIHDFKITGETAHEIRFTQGVYNRITGIAKYQIKELPKFLRKMASFHKSTINSPLFFLNVFFGVSLLFFSISAFFMYVKTTRIFKKGIYIAITGIVLALIMMLL